MKYIKLMLALCMLVGCSPASPVLPVPTPSPAATSSTTATHTRLFAPTPTPLPPETMPFYHLRLEYASTSDWAALYVNDPGTVLTSQLVSTTGEATTASIAIEDNGRMIFELNQSLANSQAGMRVTMTVDLAISIEDPPQSLTFLSKHGAINGSGWSVSVISGEETILIEDINHYWVDQNNPDTSAYDVTVDLASLTTISPAEVQVQRPNPMVWAVYYAAYGNITGSGGWFWPDMIVDRPLNFYESIDSQAIASQIQQAKSAGIDGFFVSDTDLRDIWYGNQFRYMLNEAEKQNFRIAIFLEAANIPNGMQSVDDLYEWISYGIATYGDHPAYMQLNGKPLVVVYAASGYSPQTWAELFDRLESDGTQASYLAMGYDMAYLSVFDGIFDYAIFNYPNLAELYTSLSRSVRNFTLLTPNSSPKIFMATVQPGFNDLYWTTSPTIVDREDGQFYRTTFDAAIASDPDWIMITTWNEFTEATNIEPSELYGDQYLQITSEYVSAWKNTWLP